MLFPNGLCMSLHSDLILYHLPRIEITFAFLQCLSLVGSGIAMATRGPAVLQFQVWNFSVNIWPRWVMSKWSGQHNASSVFSSNCLSSCDLYATKMHVEVSPAASPVKTSIGCSVSSSASSLYPFCTFSLPKSPLFFLAAFQLSR